MHVAVASLSRICSWASRLEPSAPDRIISSTTTSCNAALRVLNVDLTCLADERNQFIWFSCADLDLILEQVRLLRIDKKTASLRFAGWGIASGESLEEVRDRALFLASRTDPPNASVLVDASLGAMSQNESSSIHPAPRGAEWYETMQIECVEPAPRVKATEPIRGYTDAGDTRGWVNIIGGETALAVFGSTLIDAIRANIDRMGLKHIVAGALGADGMHIRGDNIPDSADRLLRLAMTTQSQFAQHGAALLPWVLDVGVDTYKDDQPNDRCFLGMVDELKMVLNGQIVISEQYAGLLERAPHKSLVSTAEGGWCEVAWWKYPCRGDVDVTE